MKKVHTLQLKSVHSVLVQLDYNRSPLIILSALPHFPQNQLKYTEALYGFLTKVFQMSNTCHAYRLKRASLVTSSIKFLFVIEFPVWDKQ